MYDWLMSSLAVGASIVLYDGSPFLPDKDVLWRLVDQLGFGLVYGSSFWIVPNRFSHLRITMFGTSAKWLSVIEEMKVPQQKHNFDTLKIIYSTGSPLKPCSFDYIYSAIKKDVIIGSITGKWSLL